MTKIKVYKFKFYDGNTDEERVSPTWRPRQVIEDGRLGAIIEESEREVDESALDAWSRYKD